MKNEDRAPSEHFVVQGVGTIVGLVVVHRDPGSEEHRRNPVVHKDLLVGEPVEDFCEVCASVVTVGEFQIGGVESVAH